MPIGGASNNWKILKRALAADTRVRRTRQQQQQQQQHLGYNSFVTRYSFHEAFTGGKKEPDKGPASNRRLMTVGGATPGATL